MNNTDTDAVGADTEVIERIRAALEEVKDPEIPTVSIVELGIIEDIRIEGARASVTIIPTFSGCPALSAIKEDIAAALERLGWIADVIVSRKPWSTDRMADSAREKMKRIGIAPARIHGGNVEWELLAPVPCPFCGSTNSALESGFGPTLCRAMYYCKDCRQPFEKFKPL